MFSICSMIDTDIMFVTRKKSWGNFRKGGEGVLRLRILLALPMQRPGSLLWHRFNPWPGNVHILWVLSKKKNKNKQQKVEFFSPSSLAFKMRLLVCCQ